MSRPIGSASRTVQSDDGLTGERVVTVLYACDECGLVLTDPAAHDALEHPPEPPAITVAIELEHGQ